MSKQTENLIGLVYGRLTVISKAKRAKYKWRCICICGTEKFIRSDKLKEGSTVSCGCYRSENVIEAGKKRGRAHPAFKHGHAMVKTPTYYSWESMISRCLRPSHDNYPNYGGRGILICPQWLGKNGFETFLKDLGERPAGKTLDRINANGSYEPSNVRWATSKEQANNKRGDCEQESIPTTQAG